MKTTMHQLLFAVGDLKGLAQFGAWWCIWLAEPVFRIPANIMVVSRNTSLTTASKGWVLDIQVTPINQRLEHFPGACEELSDDHQSAWYWLKSPATTPVIKTQAESRKKGEREAVPLVILVFWLFLLGKFKLQWLLIWQLSPQILTLGSSHLSVWRKQSEYPCETPHANLSLTKQKVRNTLKCTIKICRKHVEVGFSFSLSSLFGPLERKTSNISERHGPFLSENVYKLIWKSVIVSSDLN